MTGVDKDKPSDGSSSPPASNSGEGSDTALQALIRKRQLRAEDESPTSTLGEDAEPDPAPA